jgi:arylsulfatase A-like enzyme
MVKIDAPGRLVVKRSTIEEKLGREFELQSIHINLISLAGNIDIVPTILTAAGVSVPAGLPGIDLLDPGAVAARDTLFLANYAHDMASPTEPEKSLWTRSCIHGTWKLVSWRPDPPEVKPSLGAWQHKNPDAMQELFDLAADPHETTNLAATRPEKVRELQARIDGWWNPLGARP